MPKILIVEDQKDIKEFVVNFFSKYKIETIGTEKAEDAIEIVKNVELDLVILDIHLPGIDGIEALKIIKQIKPHIKVIMVTGKSPQEDNALKRTQELGALAYIHKPIRLEELKETVLKELNLT